MPTKTSAMSSMALTVIRPESSVMATGAGFGASSAIPIRPGLPPLVMDCHIANAPHRPRSDNSSAA